MKKVIFQQLFDTYSVFWRIFEAVSSLVGWAVMLWVAVSTWNVIAAADKMGAADISAIASNIPYVLVGMICLWTIDFFKFCFTRSPRDNPFRKWLSFKWAQKFKPNEVIVLPHGYTGDQSDLNLTSCPKCQVTHGFRQDETESRICQFNRCGEKVAPPPVDADGATESAKINEARNTIASEHEPKGEKPKTIYDEIKFAPLRVVLKYSWVVSEHAFKLAAWMAGASALFAFGQRIDDPIVSGFGIGFSILWAITLASIIFKATTFVLDGIVDNWVYGKKRNNVIYILMSAVVTAVVVVPMTQIFLLSIGIFLRKFSKGGIVN